MREQAQHIVLQKATSKTELTYIIFAAQYQRLNTDLLKDMKFLIQRSYTLYDNRQAFLAEYHIISWKVEDQERTAIEVIIILNEQLTYCSTIIQSIIRELCLRSESTILLCLQKRYFTRKGEATVLAIQTISQRRYTSYYQVPRRHACQVTQMLSRQCLSAHIPARLYAIKNICAEIYKQTIRSILSSIQQQLTIGKILYLTLGEAAHNITQYTV